MTTLEEGLRATRTQATADRTKFRKTVNTVVNAVTGGLAFVLISYWVYDAIYNNLDDVYPDEVVHYPAAPPPARTPTVITRKSCHEGNIRYTTESFTKGTIEVLNDEECSFSPSVKAGLVQFLDHFGKPIGEPWGPETDASGRTIPVKAQCLGLAEVCIVKYVLCPNGQGPLPGSWECQMSAKGTVNEYGVTAGVDLRLGVYHNSP